MAQTQTSPWAGVPYTSDTTMADIAPPPSVWAAPVAPDLPAPAMPQVVQAPKMDLHKDLPPVFAPVDPQKEIEQHLQGALQNDYQKDANPYGSENNHPGFLGKLAHALSHATGGDTRRQWEEQGLAKQLNDVEGDESTNKYRGAETAKDTEETAEMPQKAADAHAQSGATTTNLTSEATDRDAALQNPPLATAYAHRVSEVIKGGGDPSTDPVVQHLADAITSLQPGQNKATALTHVNLTAPDGKPMAASYNPATGKYTDAGGKEITNPVPYEKAPVTNVNTGTWSLGEDPTSGKPVMFNSKTGAIQDAPGAVAKPGTHAKGEAAVNNIVQAAAMAHQLQGEAEKGNAEADPALALLYFKAIKGPDGTGIRFTQTEQNMILGARNSAGDLEQIGQKVIGEGQKFTPQQRKNVVHVVDMYAQAAQRQHAGGGADSGAPPAGAKVRDYTDVRPKQ